MPRLIKHVQSHASAYLVCLTIAVAFVGLTESGLQAHKAVTSKYNYNDDVFPIFRDRCARCHFDGGPTPMSLLTYKDALPWAESMREELVTEKMPPWYVDPSGPAVKGGHQITAREIDTIVTWASGGTPQGDINAKLPSVPAPPKWRGGEPDLKVEMESEHVVPPNTSEEQADFLLPTSITDTKWIKAADLQPGTPNMVRDAVISIENGAILAAWVPGNDPVPAPSGAAFRLPAGAKIHLQIHYKKQWQDEQKAKPDRSTVGLYFTDPPASGREIQALAIDGPESGESTEPRTFDASLKTGARVVAVRPTLDQPYGTIDVHAVTPSGGRVSLLLLRGPRPEWRRRYWLAEPIELPSGSKIEVSLTPAPSEPDSPRTPKHYPLQIALDLVPQS